jgi:hypothetical protein
MLNWGEGIAFLNVPFCAVQYSLTGRKRDSNSKIDIRAPELGEDLVEERNTGHNTLHSISILDIEVCGQLTLLFPNNLASPSVSPTTKPP